MTVTPTATVEGSAFATHANDCDSCDPRVAFVPASDHAPGVLRPVAPMRDDFPRYVGAGRSATYAAEEGQRPTEPIGYIPEVPHTYAYWETGYPLLNEHGLGFGESTCAAKLVGRSVADGGTAIFCIAELMRLAAERCRTARCAITTMGGAAEEYGFSGEDPGEPGAGESVSIVDRHEAWIFHITGGLENKSATWVAQRVPDGHMTVTANNFIIDRVDCGDEANFICSRRMFANARAAGLCDFATEADFSWRECYGPDIRHFSYMPGSPPIPYYTAARLWRLQSLASGQELKVSNNPWSFNFSVPVKGKVSRSTVMTWMRDHYEGTEFDLTQGVMAGPFNNPNRLEGTAGKKKVPGQSARGMSLARTSYGILAEAKPEALAGQSIAWFSTDRPDSGVFVPFFATSTACDARYTRGHQEVFSRDSAWWAFNFVANYMNLNFRDMSQMMVYPARDEAQAHVLEEVARLEAAWPGAGAALDEKQRALQEEVVSGWWNMSDRLIAMFQDGLYVKPEGGVEAQSYPAWWLEMIGYSDDFIHAHWVAPAAGPPSLLLPELPAALLRKAAARGAQFLGATGGKALASWDGFLPGFLVGACCVGIACSLMARRQSRHGYVHLLG